MDVKMDAKKNATLRFAFFVGLGGIIVPCFVTLFYHSWQARITTFTSFTLIMVALVIVAASPFLAYVSYDKRPKWETKTDWFLYSVGVLAVILIAVIVHHTGGLPYSLFTFFFLFVPSAVAIAFEARTGLKFVCFASFLAIAYNLLKPALELPDSPYTSASYKLTYIVFVGLHLLIIYFLETRGRTTQGIPASVQ